MRQGLSFFLDGVAHGAESPSHNSCRLLRTQEHGGGHANALSESLFRTTKYRPEFPTKGFETLEAARESGAQFVHWYNLEHKHSGIRYVSPQQHHTGEDHANLAASHALSTEPKERNPARWARHARDWSPMGPGHPQPRT